MTTSYSPPVMSCISLPANESVGLMKVPFPRYDSPESRIRELVRNLKNDILRHTRIKEYSSPTLLSLFCRRPHNKNIHVATGRISPVNRNAEPAAF